MFSFWTVTIYDVVNIVHFVVLFIYVSPHFVDKFGEVILATMVATLFYSWSTFAFK